MEVTPFISVNQGLALHLANSIASPALASHAVIDRVQVSSSGLYIIKWIEWPELLGPCLIY